MISYTKYTMRDQICQLSNKVRTQQEDAVRGKIRFCDARWAQGKTAMRPCQLDLATVRQGSIATGLSGRSFMRRLMDGLRRKVGFCGAGARREITRKPPPQVRLFTKNKTKSKKNSDCINSRNFFALPVTVSGQPEQLPVPQVSQVRRSAV